MMVGAHHDDNELMAGTIARHVAAGWRVVSVVATGSENRDNSPVREAESLAAAKLLQMETVFLRYPDDGFNDDEPACQAMVRTMREYNPDMVITHPPADYHVDHMAVSRCVLLATQRCWVGTYDCGGEPCSTVPRLYYSDAWFIPFKPDVYVPVGDRLELKKQALEYHQSQLPERGDDDMVAMEMIRARYRGIEAAVGYAEAFRFVPRGWQRRVAELLE
jgi:LmbE family N-acetylglucosaminyl deacetylase